MSSFVKIYGSIIRSTVWQQPAATKLVWLTMLILADQDGVVESSIPGLAATAGVSIEECESALAVFLAPDRYSHSKVDEGRRVRVLHNGWLIINHGYYRELRTEKQVRDANRQALKRARDTGDMSQHEATCRNVAADSNTDPDLESDPEGDPDPERAREPEPPVRADRILPVGVPAVARTISLPSKDPPKEYLDVALMGGVKPAQARSTWAHYYGAGLPPGGVERLNDGLTQRAVERANSQARVRGSPVEAPVAPKPAAEAAREWREMEAREYERE